MQINMRGGPREGPPQRDREEMTRCREAGQGDYCQKNLGVRGFLEEIIQLYRMQLQVS